MSAPEGNTTAVVRKNARFMHTRMPTTETWCQYSQHHAHCSTRTKDAATRRYRPVSRMPAPLSQLYGRPTGTSTYQLPDFPFGGVQNAQKYIRIARSVCKHGGQRARKPDQAGRKNMIKPNSYVRIYTCSHSKELDKATPWVKICENTEDGILPGIYE